VKGNSSHFGEPALELPAISMAGGPTVKRDADNFSIISQLMRPKQQCLGEARWYREKPRPCY